MDGKKHAGWLYLVSMIWYILGVVRLTRDGLTAGLVWLCLGSVFFCLASAQADREKDPKQTQKPEKEESSHESTP